MKNVIVGAAVMNQTPKAWKQNKANIVEAIRQGREKNVVGLCLHELCIPSYGLADWLKSVGAQRRSLQILFEIAPLTKGMIVSAGLPLMYRGALYNVVAMIVDGKVVGFVPKKNLANDGIHYERRWFQAWEKGKRGFIEIDGVSYPIGDIHFDIGGIKWAFEICEEAWVAKRPAEELGLKGVDIIFNPSFSHFAFGKMAVRKEFVTEASRRMGVSYVYANGLGLESGQALADGGALISSEGRIIAQGPRMRFEDVIVTEAMIDIDRTRFLQSDTASREPLLEEEPGECIRVAFEYPKVGPRPNVLELEPWEESAHLEQEEFLRGQALIHFDEIRKVKSTGYVNSLSGGRDSVIAALYVWLSAVMGVRQLGLAGYKAKLGHIAAIQNATSVEEIMPELLINVYQYAEGGGIVYDTIKGEAVTSQLAAQKVAAAFHTTYYDWSIDPLFNMFRDMVGKVRGIEQWDWTDRVQDLAMQNLKARVRAPGVWMLANLTGKILISTGNQSESERKYFTMDGDTAGGRAPNGGVHKTFINETLTWAETEGPIGYGSIPVLQYVNCQKASAELRPAEFKQTDEDDAGPYSLRDSFSHNALRMKEEPLDVYLIMRQQFPQYTPQQLVTWISGFYRSWAAGEWARRRLAAAVHFHSYDVDSRQGTRAPILWDFEEELAEMAEYAQGEIEQLAAATKVTATPQGGNMIDTTNGAADAATTPAKRKRALGLVDAVNDFGSATHGNGAGLTAQLPVPEGELIGEPIGRLQDEGDYDVTFAGNDDHPADMFNFASQNPDKKPYVDQVADRDGEMWTVWPDHCLHGSWGADFLPGVRRDKITRIFPKGTARDKDSFAATGNEELIPWLHENEVTDVDLVGLVFRICVGITAIKLAEAGFKVRVVVDGTRDLDVPAFAWVIERMKELGVEFVTVDQVLAEKK